MTRDPTRPSWASDPDSPEGAREEEVRQKVGVTWRELQLSEYALHQAEEAKLARTEAAELRAASEELAIKVHARAVEMSRTEAARKAAIAEARDPANAREVKSQKDRAREELMRKQIEGLARREDLSIRAIAKRIGCDRKTVSRIVGPNHRSKLRRK